MLLVIQIILIQSILPSAVARGAKIIEKHVYLDGKNFGPDRDVSISFKQLREMVDAIRKIEIALGDKKTNL